MAQNDQPHFRLTVLNASGRDLEQQFPDGAGETAQPHPPINFHAYAACTGGGFHREVRRALAEATPVLLLLRGDFSASERALAALQKEGRAVAVALKETGLHQIADQLREPVRLARFVRIVGQGMFASHPRLKRHFYRRFEAVQIESLSSDSLSSRRSPLEFFTANHHTFGIFI